MENLSIIRHDEIYKLGYECAFEENKIDVNKFKLTEEEKKIFMEGYEAALNEVDYLVSNQEQTNGMGKAA